MNQNVYVAGIDIGTTGAKTAIINVTGEVIGRGYQEYSCTYPKPNWVEQDPTEIVDKAMESAREAIFKAKIEPESISSISLSTQRTCSIFLDKNGQPLRPLISWQDNRTVHEVEEIKQKISPSEYYQLTGLPLNTTWILTKMMWVRKNEPQVWEKTYKVVQLQDFVLRALGADDYYIDEPDATLFGLWDPEKMSWNYDLLKMFYIDEKTLPHVIPSGTQIGKISKYASEITGFSKGTPICVGAGDQNSAAVGAGIISNEYASVSLGTGGMVISYLDEPYRDPQEMSCVTNHAISGQWQLEGYQAGSASVFRWFRDEITQIEKAFAKTHNKDVYELLNAMIHKAPTGAKGLLMLPYLASSTSPRWNPNARGTLLGLTFAHDRNCMARAFVEGITFEIKDIITSMLNTGIHIEKIRIMGGPTKSVIWNQIQSDMYNIPVETLKVTDAALVGAAIFAFVGVGYYKDIREGVKNMINVDKIYEPNTRNVEIYNRLYDVYCDTYKGLNENQAYEKIAIIQEIYY